MEKFRFDLAKEEEENVRAQMPPVALYTFSALWFL